MRSRLNAILAEAVTEEALPGLTAAVVTDRGSWTGAAGRDGARRRLVPGAVMAIGSVSKTFTAAEVLHLVRTGKVNLNDPLRRYVDSRLTRNGATIGQALSMLTGLSDGQYGPRVQALATRDPSVHVALAGALDLDTETPPAPGVAQSYSNISYLLLASVVEKVTGRPFGRGLHRDLIDPNRLSSVAVQDIDHPRSPWAYPADANGDPPIRDGYLPDRTVASAALGAGSIASDAADLARWGYLLYGGSVLPASLTKKMVTTPGSGSTTSGYGLGTMIFDPEQTGIPDPAFGHNGLIYRTVSGAQDGYTSLLITAPTRHVSVAVLIPQTGKNPQPAAFRLLAAALT